jgi:HlyD family secretion protein
VNYGGLPNKGEARPDVPQQTGSNDRLRVLLHRCGRAMVAGLALVVASAVVALALLLHGRSGSSLNRSDVKVATVTRGNFVRDVVVNGRVVETMSPTLYAPAGGSVTLKVHSGNTVEQGQVLAVIDSPELAAKVFQEQVTLESLVIDWKRAQLEAGQALAQVREAYRQADIDRQTARREVDRSRKAYEVGSYSELQVLRAEDLLEKSQFAYQQAKTNYDTQPERNRFNVDLKRTQVDRQRFLVAELRRQVDALQVRSPVDGVIDEVNISGPESVLKDAPLLSVVGFSGLQVEVKASEDFARDLRSGIAVNIASGSRIWKGTVYAALSNWVNGELVSSLRVRGPELGGLHRDQRVSVRIFLNPHDNVLMVDRGPSLVHSGDGFVYLVHDHVAERRPVRLGAASTDKVEITDGLSEGQQIVIAGTDTFRGAQRVFLGW